MQSNKLPCNLSTSLSALDILCLFLAPLAGGAGNYMALYFSSTLHWGPDKIGALLAIMSISMAVIQIPAGVSIDKTLKLRQIVIAALVVLLFSWLFILLSPLFYTVAAAEVLIGGCCALFMPALASITMGLVGLKNFDIRMGRNGVFSHIGNVLTALFVILCIGMLGVQSILILLIVFAILAVVAATRIQGECIDYSYLHRQHEKPQPIHPLLGGFANLFGSRTSVCFTIAALFYTFADASMLPLMVQRVAHVGSKAASMHVPAALCLTELVMIPVCYIAAKRAPLGRKPLLIISYIFLFIRGFCFSLTNNPNILLGLQILDGISAGIFGLMLTLVISDLSINTGRFNTTLTTMGVLFTLTNGISNFIFGFAAGKFGYSPSFDTMAVCAVLGGLLMWTLVPETVKNRSLGLSGS